MASFLEMRTCCADVLWSLAYEAMFGQSRSVSPLTIRDISRQHSSIIQPAMLQQRSRRHTVAEERYDLQRRRMLAPCHSDVAYEMQNLSSCCQTPGHLAPRLLHQIVQLSCVHPMIWELQATRLFLCQTSSSASPSSTPLALLNTSPDIHKHF